VLNTKDSCYLVAEIGINHNGSIHTAKQLIKTAKEAGFDCVKFQKRTLDVVYTSEALAAPRESPFGTTNGDLKRALEFSYDQYVELDQYCLELGIDWTASPWDEQSAEFISSFDVPHIKVASACITDKALLTSTAKLGVPLWLSTGMSDLDTIIKAVRAVEESGGEVGMLYHCNSTYPCEVRNLGLLGIHTLNAVFPHIKIGYSGHETGVTTSVMAAVLGVFAIERHVTLNRAMYGSDQAASLEPPGMRRLVRDVRTWELARGDGKIGIYEEEVPIKNKLRRVDTL